MNWGGSGFVGAKVVEELAQLGDREDLIATGGCQVAAHGFVEAGAGLAVHKADLIPTGPLALADGA